MSKKVAVLAVNPVNGMGLFQYLEAFFENGITCEVFAVAETPHIHTNSGIALTTHGVVADLRGRADDFDALVFACGDAVPLFAQNASKPYNLDLMEVLRAFGSKGKLMIGHCAAGMLFDLAGIAGGKRLAVHPLAKGAVQHAIATDAPTEIDGNFYTAQQEHTLPALIGRIVEALK